MTAPTLLDHLRRSGVHLAVTGSGDIHFKAPAGVLTPNLKDALKRHKAELVELLAVHSNPGADPGRPRGPRTTYINPTATPEDLATLDEHFGDTVQDHETYETMIEEVNQTWAQKAAALLSKIDDPEHRADLRQRFEERLDICAIDGGLTEDEAAKVAHHELAREVGR